MVGFKSWLAASGFASVAYVRKCVHSVLLRRHSDGLETRETRLMTSLESEETKDMSRKLGVAVTLFRQRLRM